MGRRGSCASRSTSTLAAHAPVGAPATWLISNHDVTRPVTRYGQADTSFAFARKRRGTPADLDLGRRRARAASLLVRRAARLALHLPGRGAGPRGGPGPARATSSQDPMYFRSGGVDPGRDGCRVPLPWSRRPSRRSASAPRARRPSRGSASPTGWAALTVEAQLADPESMLNLYRSALRIRRLDAQLGDGSLRVARRPPDGVLAFARGPGFVVRHQPLAGRRRAAGRGRGAPRQRTSSTTGGCQPMRRPGSASDPDSPAAAGPSTREAA